jgi:acetyltransferase-like isoleucine patch superfamily enzyme
MLATVRQENSRMTWLSDLMAPLRARLFARRKGVACGTGFKLIGKTPWTQNHGRIDIGKHVTIRSLTASARFATQPGAAISIGDHTFINSAVAIAAARSVEIGGDCLIADFVTIFDTNFHQIDEGVEPKTAPTRIGRNVWIGRSAIILPGTTIGDHSVIGAGSVVSGVIPEKVLAAGNPAKVLRPITASDTFRRK